MIAVILLGCIVVALIIDGLVVRPILYREKRR